MSLSLNPFVEQHTTLNPFVEQHTTLNPFVKQHTTGLGAHQDSGIREERK